VFAFYVNEATHVHIQCRNTTQMTMTCNCWYRYL